MTHHFRRPLGLAGPLAAAGGLLLLAAPLTGTAAAASGPQSPAAARTAPSATATTGWLRLAHLSPDTPNVDVYLTPFGATKAVVLRSVGYGDVSAYRSVPAGTYTAAMWLAGKAKSGAPILSGSATIAAGKAYTVAAVGRRADITAKVLVDDLTPPASGDGRVRVIQASTQASVVTISAQGGPVIAQGTRFGASSDYTTVPAGRWQLTVKPQSGAAKALSTSVDVRPGSVTSLFLLDAGSGRLKLAANVDSRGAAAMPSGAVNTGYGPSEQQSSAPGTTTGAGAALLGCAGLAGFTGVARRRARAARAR